MVRHRIRVAAPAKPVLDVLRATGLAIVEVTDVDRGFIHIPGAAGYFTHADDTTLIDVFEFDSSDRVNQLVDALLDAGLDVLRMS